MIALLPIFPSCHPASLESIHYDFVYNFDLSISLGISWGGVPIRNPKIITVSPKRFAIKLKVIF